MAEISTFLDLLGIKPAHCIPVAAKTGANIAHRSPLTPWWTGPTVIEALDGLVDTDNLATKPLRFVVQEGTARQALETALIGAYNVSNLLGVIAAMRTLGVPLDAAFEVVSKLGVPYSDSTLKECRAQAQAQAAGGGRRARRGRCRRRRGRALLDPADAVEQRLQIAPARL